MARISDAIRATSQKQRKLEKLLADVESNAISLAAACSKLSERVLMAEESSEEG